MPVIRLPANNWQPRNYQKPAWNAWMQGCKHLELVWHRRSGKDDIALHGTAIHAMERVATYWHMLPLANQARKAIWDAINPNTGMRRIDEAFPREIRANTREQEMMIKFKNGSTWQVLGSDNFQGAIGSPPAGIVYSEWALAKPSARAYLRPILAENGGWQTFITTPRGKNHAYRTYNAGLQNDRVFAQRLDATQTDVFPPAQLEYERQEYIKEWGHDIGTALFEQEFMVSFDAAIVGAYYAGELRTLEESGRLGQFKHDPNYPVFTAWDLGHDDDTVVLIYQIILGEVRIIDYISDSGKDLSYYISQLLGRRVNLVIAYGKVNIEYGGPIEGLAHRREYDIQQINLPHDGKAKTLAAQGKSVEEQLAAVFTWSQVRIVPSLSLQDGIQAARQLIARLWVDVCCEDAVEAWKQYRREWDDDKKMFKDHPLHDWTSHFADALRYLAIVWQEKRPAPKDKGKPIKTMHEMTFNDLRKAKPKRNKRI